ncbi:hypothetical protein B0H13DRAFT_2098677 [Mycena leptocephala]|nr:hypothetical protein B0H13DRAFT_2098677 [Mycena leptocephala]
MSNPFNWTFDKVASAHALFFNNDHNQRALRLECPDLALEFTDGAYIGRDPEGFLYYDDLANFQKDTGTKHNYEVSQDSINNKTYAVIQFRHAVNDKPYAKFYAPDEAKVATAAKMADYSSTGNWVTFKSASCYAASWDAGSTTFSPSSFSVPGYLHFKKFKTLKDGKYANYNNDRVVFYANDWTGTDFVGFVPLEDAKDTLGIQSTKTTTAVTFTDVKWESD